MTDDVVAAITGNAGRDRLGLNGGGSGSRRASRPSTWTNEVCHRYRDVSQPEGHRDVAGARRSRGRSQHDHGHRRERSRRNAASLGRGPEEGRRDGAARAGLGAAGRVSACTAQPVPTVGTSRPCGCWSPAARASSGRTSCSTSPLPATGSSRSTTCRRGPGPRGGAAKAGPARCVEGSIEDAAAMRRAMKGIDAVVHLAARPASRTPCRTPSSTTGRTSRARST